MAIPQLPIEVCELIIDICASQFYHTVARYSDDRSRLHQDLGALLACALTCKAWFPRSIVNLYRIVILSGNQATTRFVKAFAERSKTLNLQICYLWISTTTPPQVDHNNRTRLKIHIVPYLLAAQSGRINRVSVLHIEDSLWHHHSEFIGRRTPDIFFRSLATFRSVTVLILNSVRFEGFPYLSRLILSLRNLRHLRISVITFLARTPVFDLSGRRWLPALRHLDLTEISPMSFGNICRWIIPACSQLESLALAPMVWEYRDLPLVQNFVTTAGKSLRELEVKGNSGTSSQSEKPSKFSINRY